MPQSREAAKECSPRRKAWGDSEEETKPQRGERKDVWINGAAQFDLLSAAAASSRRPALLPAGRGISLKMLPIHGRSPRLKQRMIRPARCRKAPPKIARQFTGGQPRRCHPCPGGTPEPCLILVEKER